jgi:hypothetical protein
MTNTTMRVLQQSPGLLASTREVLLEQTTKLASNTQMSRKSPKARSFKEEEAFT